MGLFNSKGVVYRPVKDVNLGPHSTEFYLQANVKAPRMTGVVVKIFTWFLESRLFGALLLYILKANNLIHKLITNAELEESPLYVPLHHFEDYKEQKVKCLDSALTPPEQVRLAIDCLPTTSENVLNAEKPSFCRWTIRDYSRAYGSWDITPRMAAERFIAAVGESSKPPFQMGFFINYNSDDILRQADESTLRYQKVEPISVLDGVLVAIKDGIDCLPYPTTGGTKWLHKQSPCADDACCVKRPRLCGAILVGKTNMHELGSGASGINPHYGPTRNPYKTDKIAGGSSSGSAAVVSAGLCPVALGVDRGGSVRVRAALCGVVGLKPTFGRVPHSGYAAISDEVLSHQPSNILTKTNLPLLPLTKPIPDIKLAKYGKWFDDCSDDVRICCSHALDKLQDHYGWKIVDITIPEIEAMRLAHYITIGSECSTSLDSFREKNRQLQFHKKILAEAVVTVSPTTGVTAYPIQDDALKTGELDYINAAALFRYSISGNFLGLPAVTITIGYDKLGLSIGLQFIGRPWAEATLIHLAFAMQAICKSEYREPAVFYDLLGKG